MYMYIAPGQGQTTHWAQNIPSKFFAIKRQIPTQVDLSIKSQGYPRVLIYTIFVELHCLMLRAKFQNHRPSGSGEDFLRF